MNVVLSLLLGATTAGLAAYTAAAQDLRNDDAGFAETEIGKEIVTAVDSLTIPDELYPAVRPYMDCRIAANQIPPIQDGKLVENPGIPERCQALRAKGMTEGEQILRSRYATSNNEERQARLMQLFTQIDEFLRPRTKEEMEELIRSQQSTQ